MNFDLSEEHEEFRNVVRDFADNEIRPHVEAWDRDHYFPIDTVKQMGDMGLFGLVFPEKYGGADADFTTLCVAIEELARVDSSMAITLSAGVGLGAMPVYAFGTEDQREEWLPDLVAGRTLGAFGLTEPDAGSDAGATRSKAKRDGDDWVINGTKAFITNSGTEMTSIVTVTAKTDLGISAFVIPAGSDGLEVEPAYRKMGWHASDTHGLVLNDCRVPEANLLGTEGKGFHQFLATLDDGRIAIAALAVGLAQACLDESVEYAKTRQAFGGPIGRNQAVSFACADLSVQLEAARLLTYRAAWLKDQSRPFKQEAAIAKLHATEAAVSATRVATQIFGGYGFIDETPVSRFYRDAKILEIGEGTSEIQRLVISRGLGLPVA
ncbi:MAG: acyl-CoA dehydrogenase family protein [Acidimicrobiales bacterium]